MRQLNVFPIDPEIAALLDAIDATLAGDPVDPQYAEIAELALLLAADRPVVRPEFAADLDARVERGFGRAPRAGATGPVARRGTSRNWWPAAGGIAGALAAVALVVVLVGGTGTPSQQDAVRLPQRQHSESVVAAGDSTSAAAGTATSAVAGSSTAGGTLAQQLSPTAGAPSKKYAAPVPAPAPAQLARHAAAAKSLPSASASGAGASASAGRAAAAATSPAPATGPSASNGTFSGNFFQNGNAGGPGTGGVQPHANGRKQIQSAQLALTVAPRRVDQVTQEAFDVIGAEQGIVDHSTVSAGGGQSGGYAIIQISVPSQNLAQTMTELSELPHATVAERTDMSQDVNDQYLTDVRRLADAKALRIKLLKELASAVTAEQVDSLTAQIKSAEATITSDSNTLDSLNKRVNLSQIQLTINSGPVPVAHPESSGGFNLHTAAHDAGRVLVVGAGVALIALAVLVPLGLVAALVLWVAALLRRRGREHALDLA
jgi:hypothetical protein